MNILVYNVRSILEYQRRTTFSNAVQVKNAHQVICLTETWLTESIGDAALFLTNYVIHRNDRPSDKGLTKHGGVLIAVNRNIPSSQINSAFQDCVIIRISLNKPILVCCIYSGPSNSTYTWDISDLIELLKFLRRKQFEQSAICSYIVGDINFNCTHWPSMTCEQSILDELCESNFQQLIKTPDGKSLGVFLSNKPQFVTGVKLDNRLSSLLSSDHLPLHAKVSFDYRPVNNNTPAIKQKLDFGIFAYKKANWEELNEFIRQHPFQPFCLSNVELMLDHWYEWLYEILQDLLPITTKHRSELAPWVGSDSSNLIKKLNTLQLKNQRTPAPSNEGKIENLQTELTLSLQIDQHLHQKMVFENGKFSEIQRYLKSITKSRMIPSEIFLDQKIANTDAQKAELFNIYFQSVFTRNANVGKAERQDNVLLNSINFTIDEIEDALNELHVNKANGPDMIGNSLLKNLSKSLPKSLHLFFNLIANKAIFSTKQKISEIAPIFKDGDKQDVSNYMPISLLSAVSKLLEKLIFEKLAQLSTQHLHQTNTVLDLNDRR